MFLPFSAPLSWFWDRGSGRGRRT